VASGAVGRKCSVCMHPSRDQIDELLASHALSFRAIGRQYGLSKDAVRRHVRGRGDDEESHIARRLQKAYDEEEFRHAVDLVRQFKAINAAALAILKEAREQKRNTTALLAIDRVQRQLELQFKVAGDLDERPVLNILAHPEYIQVRTLIVEALQPFPQARYAVVRALEAGGNGRA
jgi:hypothetical protein